MPRPAHAGSLLVGLLALLVPACAWGAPLRPAPAGQRLPIVLPLVADDAGLTAFATAVSSPGSPLYGRYEPVALLARRFGASSALQLRALRFLRAAGARHPAISPTGMFATATFTVAQAERAFRLPLAEVGAGAGRYVAPVTALGAAGEASVRLPAGLQGVATGVVGLDTMPLSGPRPRHVSPPSRRTARAAGGIPFSGYFPASGTPSGCAAGAATGGFTPHQFLTAYGYEGLRADGFGGQGEKIALVEVDGFKASDIETYASCFGLRVPRLVTFPVSSHTPLAPGAESTLDLEVLDSAAPDLSQIEVYENSTAADVNQSLVLPLLVPGEKPAVISASLGMCETDLRQAFGTSGIDLVEREVRLAAATGITVVAASGDAGSEGCVADDGTPLPALAVQYPASSPYVTAIGGTNITLNAANVITGQVVWNDGQGQLAAGGGGQSILFSRPSYQGGVVRQNHRAVPDLALLADLAPGYAVFCSAAGDPDCSARQPWETIGGTSAAAPLFAGGAALVDQDLAHHHREQLGFVNPLIYTLGRSATGRSIFSDVTQYSNDLGPFLPGTNGAPLGCCTAGPGYDDASGWGGIDLTAFADAALFFQPSFGDVSIAFPRGQHPLAHHGLVVKLSCSQACRAYAFGVFVDQGFIIKTSTITLHRRGSRDVEIRFSTAQRRSISTALRRHQPAQAEVFGVGLGPKGEAAAVTAGTLTAVRS